MPTYVMLVNLTKEGIKEITDAPQRVERFRNLLKSEGGTLKDIYYVFGQYDLVAIADAPNDGAIAKVVLKNGSYGKARIETLKAFSEADGTEIIKGLQ